MATILVLLSSFLPFINNIIRNFGILDTTSIVFDNVAGARKLDLDDAIFFLSMPVSYLFISIGARLQAHKYSFYAVYLSCYLQFFFIIRFIFLDKNEMYIITQVAAFMLFVVAAVVVLLTEKYLRKITIADDFRNKSLDRTLSILSKKKGEIK